jgi:uncharacterized protein YndB with AHSA1/START domain
MTVLDFINVWPTAESAAPRTAGSRRRSMTHVVSRTSIRRSPVQIFDFATTPAHWAQWLPSGEVSGAVDHPLQAGEQVTEELLITRRRSTVAWTVIECEPPRRWAMAGILNGLGHVVVAYEVTPRPDGTMFERDFGYSMPRGAYRLLDWLLVRPQIQADSALALRRLRELLEASRFWTASPMET